MALEVISKMTTIIEGLISEQDKAESIVEAATGNNDASDSFKSAQVSQAKSTFKSAVISSSEKLRSLYEEFTGNVIANDGFVTGANAAQFQNAIAIMKAVGKNLNTDDLIVLFAPFQTSEVMYRALINIAEEYCDNTAVAQFDETKMPGYTNGPSDSKLKRVLNVLVSDIESLANRDIFSTDNSFWLTVLDSKLTALQNLSTAK